MKKVLIANRGEIAVRIIRGLQEMRIGSVAVYSDADEDSVHVKLADEAIRIGAPEPSASYLNMERVIEAAKESGADAIHPGYGFLSERAEFADLCEKNGITFIGPSAGAMRQLGAKIDAKQLAVKNDVPVTPGFFEPGATRDQLKEAAERIGFPVMLKASAGGGGRGMRIVRELSEFESAFNLATEESVKANGDGAMMVEKLVERPRHIEIQVLADQHGNVACLFERECSLQRRHQKILEEAPSPAMTEELWARMQAAARRLILAAGYTGAGTVEFMVDDKGENFYFLEVNARLQVEHPVTELITGLDLVQWQIRVADGEKLTLGEDLLVGDRRKVTGHSIEARIVAEDPAKGFLPSVGRIFHLASLDGPGIRWDSGYESGSEVSRYYDSLIGKLIVHAESRQSAILKLRNALENLHVVGIKTNIPYLLDLLRNESVIRGEFDTGFLSREFAEWESDQQIPEELSSILPFAIGSSSPGLGNAIRNESSAWSLGDGFLNALSAS